MIQVVEATEKALLDSAEQVDIRSIGDQGVPDMKRLLDYRSSSAILIGDEPARPSLGEHSAETLKRLINDHINLMAQECSIETNLLHAYLSTDDIRSPNGLMNSWSVGTFYHMPLISALDELNSIKIRLLQIELGTIAKVPSTATSTTNETRPRRRC